MIHIEVRANEELAEKIGLDSTVCDFSFFRYAEYSSCMLDLIAKSYKAFKSIVFELGYEKAHEKYFGSFYPIKIHVYGDDIEDRRFCYSFNNYEIDRTREGCTVKNA